MRALATVVLSLALGSSAWAADHGSASTVPGADLADLYSWMTPDGSRLNVVATFTTTSTVPAFPDVVYVLHVEDTDIVCELPKEHTMRCWLGDSEFAEGDPAVSVDGIDSASGDLRVWAGYRSDPFYWHQQGLVDALAMVRSTTTSDPNGCRTLSPAITTTLAAGLEGSNTFVGGKVMALAVQVHRTLITGLGPRVRVWASTHERGAE